MKNKRKYKKKVPIICEGSLPKNKAKRLRKLRGLANLSRDDIVGGNSGITKYSIRSWELGRFGGLTLDGAEKVIKRVAKEGVTCSLEWLLHGIGKAPEGTILEEEEKIKIQLATKQKEIIENETLLIAEELAFFEKQFKKTLSFQIEDDGLAPLYLPGEYVAGIELYKKHFNALDGMDCIIITEGNKTYLRKLKLGNKKNKFNLECTNTNTSVTTPIMYNVKILRAAPVIRHYKRDHLWNEPI